MSNKIIDDRKQSDWERDIGYFYKWKQLHATATAEFSKKFCAEQLQKIKDRYPQHLKNETW